MYSKRQRRLIKISSYSSVIVSIILMIVKLFAFVNTSSQSILASLIDSLLDISSSTINLVAAYIFLLPPNNKYRFGHDKFQDLAIFAQSVFFLLSCVGAIFSSIKMLYAKSVVTNQEIGITTMYISITMTFLLVSFQYYVAKQTKSKIIIADRLHYFTDLLSNLVVIVSLYLSHRFWYIDPIGGILVALYLMYGSISLLADSVKNLVDAEFDEKDKAKLLSIIKKNDQAKAIHELKTRWAGNKPFVQFHLELDPKLSLKQAHTISHQLDDAISQYFKGAEVIIHQDLYGMNENEKYREKV